MSWTFGKDTLRTREYQKTMMDRHHVVTESVFIRTAVWGTGLSEDRCFQRFQFIMVYHE